ncbi:MAG: response regulator [Spirochaetaceae bacterium]
MSLSNNIKTHSKTILVVEDDKKNLRLIRDLLVFSGYKVLEARDGRQGVDITKSNKPHLVLMDIQMPVMDGIEATSLLKKDPDICDIPVIALTSYAMRGDKQRFLDAGCDGYITKPIDISNFLVEIEKYLKDNLCDD